jgi:uncharacterized membrane protein
MNTAHLHLLFNHVPILGSIFGLILLAWGWLRRNQSAARIGLITLVVVAAFAVPAYFTGRGAEEIVEHAPGVSEAAIEPHEEAAQLASYALWVVGLISVWMLWRASRSGILSRWNTGTALLLAVVVCGLMTWTSFLGGLIRHSEIRNDAVDRGLVARGRADGPRRW